MESRQGRAYGSTAGAWHDTGSRPPGTRAAYACGMDERRLDWSPSACTPSEGVARLKRTGTPRTRIVNPRRPLTRDTSAAGRLTLCYIEEGAHAGVARGPPIQSRTPLGTPPETTVAQACTAQACPAAPSAWSPRAPATVCPPRPSPAGFPSASAGALAMSGGISCGAARGGRGMGCEHTRIPGHSQAISAGLPLRSSRPPYASPPSRPLGSWRCG